MEDLGRGLGFNTLSQRIKMWGLATFQNVGARDLQEFDSADQGTT